MSIVVASNKRNVDVEYKEYGRAELDSHADTCCVGRHALIVSRAYKSVTVTPFLASLGTVEKVPIVTAALAYDDPSGITYILILNQTLYFKEMEHALLCPMQMRLNGVIVNERPKFLTKNPTANDHAIICELLTIPLDLAGVSSYFPIRKPSKEEYEECQRIELTGTTPEWIPSDTRFAEEEEEASMIQLWYQQNIRYLHWNLYHQRY